METASHLVDNPTNYRSAIPAKSGVEFFCKPDSVHICDSIIQPWCGMK